MPEIRYCQINVKKLRVILKSSDFTLGALCGTLGSPHIPQRTPCWACMRCMRHDVLVVVSHSLTTSTSCLMHCVRVRHVRRVGCWVMCGELYCWKYIWDARVVRAVIGYPICISSLMLMRCDIFDRFDLFIPVRTACQYLLCHPLHCHNQILTPCSFTQCSVQL